MAKEQKMEARDDDRISKLSDDILHVIVSLLSEKEGLRVRSLSRRWRYLPKPQVLNLCFDGKTEYGETIRPCKDSQYHSKSKEFVTKVGQVLRNHRVKFQKLHSLQVSFCLYNEYASYIDEWVSLAVSMAVNKVEFKFPEMNLPPDETDAKTNKFYRFPWPTSTRPNLDLEYLCLESCILKPVPPDLGLSSLKTLSLAYVVLDQDDFNKIASACLKLECLKLYFCALPQTFRIGGGGGGTFDHLKSLVFYILPLGFIPNRKLIIHDLVNLKDFQSGGFGYTIDSSIRGLPSLERGRFFHHQQTTDFMFHEFPKAAPHLEILSLTLFSCLSENITKFNSLKSLELQVRSELLLSVANFLNAAPLLQKLHVKMAGQLYLQTGCARNPTASNGHVHPHLKELEINGFYGKYAEELVLYLLHNAIALERMTILPPWELIPKDEDDILIIKRVHDQLLKEIVELNGGVQLIVKPRNKIHERFTMIFHE